jgi:hypothetical protein
MLPVILATVMGCLLIIAGLAMVAYQMRMVSWKHPPERSASVSHEGLALKTTYPGLVVIAIGAAMLTIIATVP